MKGCSFSVWWWSLWRMGSWGIWRLVLIWFLAHHVPGGSGGSVLFSEISVPESSPEGDLSPQIGMEYNHSRAETTKPHESNAAVPAPSLLTKPSMAPPDIPGLSIAPVSTSSPSGHHLRQVLPASTPPLKSEKSTPTRAPPEGSHHSRHPAPFVAANPPYNVPPPSKSLPQTHTQKPIHQSAPAPIGSLVKPQINATSPSRSGFRRSPKRSFHTPAQSPASAFHKHHSRAKGKSRSPATAPAVPPASSVRGPMISPVSHPPVPFRKKNRRKAHQPWHAADHLPPSPSPSPVSSNPDKNAIAPSPSVMNPSIKGPAPHPMPPPISSQKKTKPAIPPVLHTLPPPPPNKDCSSLTCSEPLTNTLPGSPCGCIWPMQVELRLSVPLYTFFPLVSELAQEIAAGVLMKQSQVRIMGANAATEQSDMTIVLINLVPVGESFDGTTALLIYQKFWHKMVVIKPNFFGNKYDVLYVRYPGLPPSPPMSPSNITIEDGPLMTGGHGRAIKPMGVDVRKQRKKKLSGSLIAIIVLSSSIVLVLCIGVIWFLLLKSRRHDKHQPLPTPKNSQPTGKSSAGAGSMLYGSGRPSSASLSFGSSIATYTVSAKTFSLGEIERATDNFDDTKILGEGGFGRVYKGVLEDGTEVAVKVLKRDDQQGGREFLAEVEMLSRLHHRNLVKLIGICTEEHSRSLVYELIPNGSVESHLHGVDKETAPLDWGARMKIALGSARGLAYLHEDSSPRVIHRDFKSSNILLEHDFTPKVSDFGLARADLDEGNNHISTRVMGTFGYVAPEYAMTGHLLVKSDVYSYGVVLLELLTGRKPVDMSQPAGQENLVSWTRPLLTSKEGLEALIDPALGSDIPLENVGKVAAIASMCVQPEVSHRPFMGEVVQALKLVCNENEGTAQGTSPSCSQDDLPAQNVQSMASNDPHQVAEPCTLLPAAYSSGLDIERGLSASEIFSSSTRYIQQGSGSFRRHSASGPLRSGRSSNFWRRSFSRLSVSEHGLAFKLWRRSDAGQRW